jgi:hypothetical protein
MDMKLWIEGLKMVGMGKMDSLHSVCTACGSRTSVTICDNCNTGTCRECSVIVTKKLSPDVIIKHKKCRRD